MNCLPPSSRLSFSLQSPEGCRSSSLHPNCLQSGCAANRPAHEHLSCKLRFSPAKSPQHINTYLNDGRNMGSSALQNHELIVINIQLCCGFAFKPGATATGTRLEQALRERPWGLPAERGSGWQGSSRGDETQLGSAPFGAGVPGSALFRCRYGSANEVCGQPQALEAASNTACAGRTRKPSVHPLPTATAE